MATIRYLVQDVDQAVEFYLSLGFALKQSWGPPFAIMSHSDLILWLSGPESSAGRPMPDGSKPQPGGWNRLVIEVSDLDETVASLRGKGCSFRSEVVSGPGGRQILIEDPSGNPVESFEASG